MRNILMILLACWAGGLVTSCAKDGGYYDFKNEESVFDGSSIAYYQSKKGVYDSLLLVLDRLPEYRNAIEQGGVTIFSPTNASFQLAMGNLNTVRKTQGRSALRLGTLDLAQLDTLMSKYVVQGVQTTDSMQNVDGLDVKTLKYTHRMHAQRIKQDASGFVGGGLVTVFYTDKKDSNFEILWVRTATQAVNIHTSNCLVHVLASGHEFGFGEFLDRMNK